MMRSRMNGFALMHALSGLGVWALCFVVLYGGLTIGCHSAWAQRSIGPVNAVSLGLMLAWAAHAVLLGVMLVRAWRRTGSDTHMSRTGVNVALGEDRQVARGQAPMGQVRTGQAHGTQASLPDDGRDGVFVRWLTVVLHATAAVALIALAAPLLVLSPCV